MLNHLSPSESSELSVLVSIAIRVSIAAMKHHDQVYLVYLAYTSISLFIIKGSQDRNSSRAGTWRQELMQRPWTSSACWLAVMTVSACFLEPRITRTRYHLWYHTQWPEPSGTNH